MFEHKKTILPNGLTLITVPMKSVKSLTIMAFANTGSRYEAKAQFGIAHFFEHIVFKGTDKYPQAQVLAEAIDGIGANFNAFTSKEYTGYYVQATSEHLDLALDVVSDMLLSPKLRQEDIDREKGVIIEEMNMYVDMPAAYINNLFEQMAFRSSGLGHDIIGNKDTVSSITTADFQEFLNTWYQLGNLVLVVAGDDSVVGSDKTINLVESMFSKTRLGSTKKPRSYERKIEDNFLSDEKQLLVDKKTEQVHFTFGWPSIERSSKQRYALTLLNTIMGGNMSSRLFGEVREKRGLCYYIHSDIRQFHEGGLFGASAGVDPSRVEEAVKASIDEFIKSIGIKPILQTELNRAKDYIVGKMILGLEDSESVAQFFGLKQVLQGNTESPLEVIKKIKAVKLDEVQNLSKQLIQKSELRFALIGNTNQDRIKNIVNNY